MTKRVRRRFSPEYTEQAVARLSEPGASYGIVAAELGVTATQLKTWKLELDAAGSAAAIAAQRGEAAELSQLRRDNKRLKEEVAVLRKASAFFAQRPFRKGLSGPPLGESSGLSEPNWSCPCGRRPPGRSMIARRCATRLI